MALNEKTKKRLMVGVGIVAGLFVLILTLVPLLVDIDSYRPQIVEAANRQMNGKLELGKLSLSLWRGVRVRAEGISVKGPGGDPVVGAKDVDLRVGLFSLLSGAPHVTLWLESPEVNLSRDRKGRWNVLSLLKKPEGAAPTEPEPSAPQAEERPAEKGGFVQGLVARARLGLDVHRATVVYTDAMTGTKSRFDDLSLVAEDLSLTRPTTVELTAQVDTRVGEGTRVSGPLVVTASGKPEISGGELVSSDLTLAVDLTRLTVSVPGTFEKAAGVAARAEAAVRYAPASVAIQSLKVALHNAEIEGKGTISRLDPLPDGTRDPVVDFDLVSKPIALAPWGKLLPAARAYQLAGEARLTAGMKGPVSQKGYYADFTLVGASLAVPALGARPKLEAELKVRPNRVERLLIAVTGPGSDMRLVASATDFTAPKFEAELTSKGFDLDAWFPPAAKGKDKGKGTAGAGGPASAGEGAGKAKTSDYDAALAPVRGNDSLKAASGTIRLSLARIKSNGAEFRDVAGQARLARLGLDLDRLSLKAFDGSIAMKGRVDLAPRTPAYSLGVDVKGLNLQKAIESQFAPFKNTLVGIASYEMRLQGASFNPDKAKPSLKGSGKMSVAKAAFNTIDIGKVAADAINQALAKIEAQLPGAKLKIQAPANQRSEYESMTADFEIGGGKFRSPNFFAKAAPGKGLDVRGATTVGLVDQSLDARWEILDTHNLTKARDVSVNVAGTPVNNILAEGGGVVKLPVHVTGTVTDPKVNYLGVPEALAKVALDNVKRAGEERAKQELKKAAEQQIKKAAPELEKALKGIFK